MGGARVRCYGLESTWIVRFTNGQYSWERSDDWGCLPSGYPFLCCDTGFCGSWFVACVVRLCASVTKAIVRLFLWSGL